MPPSSIRRLGRGATVALCGLALLAALITPALAAEVTRAAYKEAVEPICKVNTQANERILAGVRREVRAGETRSAASRFSRAARALKSTIVELKAVPRPAVDVSRLTRWLGKVSTEAALFEAVATKLRAGQDGQAEKIVVKLTNNANQANNLVIPFEFDYCRLEPARFT
jgi:hypothetical protein